MNIYIYTFSCTVKETTFLPIAMALFCKGVVSRPQNENYFNGGKEGLIKRVFECAYMRGTSTSQGRMAASQTSL